MSPDTERDEDLSPLPTITTTGRIRRGGVSAETYSEEDATNYVKKVRMLCCTISTENLINFPLYF